MCQGRRNTVFKIATDDSRILKNWLTLENTRGQQVLDWDSIVDVQAFKRDLWAVDCICLEFRATDKSVMEVNEEMAGWQELLELLPARLSGFPVFEDWFVHAAHPAFETNLTQLWPDFELAQQTSGEVRETSSRPSD